MLCRNSITGAFDFVICITKRLEESNIKWSDTLQNAKTNIKISQDKKALDIFIISSEAINIDGGIIDICEIDVAKEVSSSKEK